MDGGIAMKKNMVKKMMMVMATMTLLVPGFHVYAEEDIIIEVQTEESAETEEDIEELIEDELILAAEVEEICTEVIIEPETEIQSVGITYTEDAAYEETVEEESELEETEEVETEEVETEAEEAETEELETEAEEAQTEESEAVDENRTFSFENDEVVINVVISNEASLPEDLEMTAKKLAEGSEKYEAAKAVTISSLGTSEEENYSFYEVHFEKEGDEVDVPESQMTVSVHFKNQLSAVQIKDGEAKNL